LDRRLLLTVGSGAKESRCCWKGCQREGQLVAGAELWWLASILFGEDGVVGFLN